jgi:protein-S-isoprenylcysteine O-methyltransferase Ste14
MNPLLRYRVPLGFLFAGWYLVIARPGSLTSYEICLAFVVTGCLLRSWAAGYLLKGKRVAVGGPYAYVRNPLYVGSFLIGAGFCAALWQWPPRFGPMAIAFTFLLGFGIVYRGKVLAEEGELGTNLGEPYQAYARRVPAFLPTRGHVDGLGEQRFSAEIYRRNREHECLFGSAALLLFLFFRYVHGS